MKKKALNRIAGREKGQALIIVMLLLLVGALIIAPMLSQVGSGLKSGKDVYEERMELFYSADTGVEDALWQVDNETLESKFASQGYDEYDYDEIYEYDDPLDINDNEVDVTIQNIWVPEAYIPAPATPAQARAIIEGNLVITSSSSMSGISTYQIKVIYNYDSVEDPGGADLKVETIGIWLPPGFDYVAGSCNLASDPDTLAYANPYDEDYGSGKVLLWTFGPTFLASFPGAAGYPIERDITFQFSGPENEIPATALSWIDTTDVDGIDYTWDADVKVYKITSTATDDRLGKQTIAEAYTAVAKLRPMGDARSGDYVAVGNTLMEATGDERYRDRLYKESSAIVQSDDPAEPGYIPATAHLDAAYLYWSGWIEEAEGTIWADSCDNMNNWVSGGVWLLDPPTGGRFMGHGGDGSNNDSATRRLTMTNSLDLSEYYGETVTVSWSQSESGNLESDDRLYYAFSGNGGSSWSSNYEAFRDDSPPGTFTTPSISNTYLTSNFKMRFRLYGFNDAGSGGTEYCYIDNIIITAEVGAGESALEMAKVNRVIFNGHQIAVDPTNPLECKAVATTQAAAGSWSYFCVYNATDLVAELIADEELEPNGAGTYTLGHWLEGNGYELYPSGSTDYPLATPALSTALRYQYTYAGWSLILVYTSPETEGHQLYLFNKFIFIAVGETLETQISGFLVPDPYAGEVNSAHITVFVGDGDEVYSGDYMALKDQDGAQHKLSDGIDIDPIQTGWSRQWFSNPYDNVWNSQSVGLSATSGIDIDTFNIPWSSDALEAGDNSATVVLGNASSNPNDAELINLVYIIVSFRSKITQGGTISYLVRG